MISDTPQIDGQRAYRLHGSRYQTPQPGGEVHRSLQGAVREGNWRTDSSLRRHRRAIVRKSKSDIQSVQLIIMQSMIFTFTYFPQR